MRDREACVLDRLNDFLGASDRVLVMDTCGSAAAVVPRFPAGGAALQISVEGARASWGSTAVTAAGGSYRLCWCTGAALNATSNASAACGRPEAFRVDFGSLLLRGPAPLAQATTCLSGRNCSIEYVEGERLDSADKCPSPPRERAAERIAGATCRVLERPRARVVTWPRLWQSEQSCRNVARAPRNVTHRRTRRAPKQFNS